jgi:signal transduction histidine kinase
MNYKYQRKLEINKWLVTMRWFYMVAVLTIGILGNSLISLFDIKFSFFQIAFVLLIFLVLNGYLYRLIFSIEGKEIKNEKKLKIASFFQILIELVVFTIILQLLGDQALGSIFFFIPIISASLIFGLRGAIITALVSALLVNASAIFSYLDLIIAFLLNRSIFNSSDFLNLRFASLEIIKIIITSNFYLVIAIISGYSSKLLFKREEEIIERTDLKNNEILERLERFQKIGEKINKVEKHDILISKINNQLGNKIKELETSEKSLFRAFSDLQIARKNAEEEREKTSAIVANFIDPIIVIDEEGRIELFNASAKSVFNFIDSDVGKEVSSNNNYSMENFKNIINQEYKISTKQVARKKNPNEEELIINYANQKLTYKIITAAVLDSRNKNLGVMKIFYNLTREKMLDKLKSEFISIAAHQLRTPLSAIKWVIKMILDGDVGEITEEQKKFLFKGYQSNERIIELVNDMLNVSRIEEGRFGYSYQKENFEKALKIVIDSLENRIKKKSIKFEVKKKGRIPNVFMDKTKMTLVLQNLLENAVKYTPDNGKIGIEIEIPSGILCIAIAIAIDKPR